MLFFCLIILSPYSNQTPLLFSKLYLISLTLFSRERLTLDHSPGSLELFSFLSVVNYPLSVCGSGLKAEGPLTYEVVIVSGPRYLSLRKYWTQGHR